VNDKLTTNHPARRIFRFIESCSRKDGSFDASPREETFNELAMELFAYQFDHNETYRKICEMRNTPPGSFAGWQRIPTVPTTAFKEFELSCLAPELRTTVFHSSGTTSQKPSRHFHSIASLELYHASLLPWFCRHVMPGTHHPMLSLTPPPDQAVHSSLAHMFGVVASEMVDGRSKFAGELGTDGAWVENIESTVAWLHARIQEGEALVLLGTAFNFVHLMDHLIESSVRLNLPAGSVVMETGGYKGRSREMPKDDLHQLIADRLGVTSNHVVCEYGMSELSSQAYDIVAGSASPIRQFKFPPWVRARIVSPETGREVGTGQTGLIQVFDLANAFSVMAVQTQDLAIRHQEGFELIGRAAATEPRGCSLTSL
jgi:hypothetical protein